VGGEGVLIINITLCLSKSLGIIIYLESLVLIVLLGLMLNLNSLLGLKNLFSKSLLR
jgi:hypothetical protein